MKRFIFYFIILLLAVLLGLSIHKDPGYVLITYQNWSIETTLWFGLLIVIVLFFVIYLLVRILRGTSRLTEKWQTWSERRKERRANKYTSQGLCQLAEGDWKQAEKSLIRGVDHTETPLINYLAAANAAQQQENFEERDNYLRLAHQSSPQAEMAIVLTQAQLQVSAKQWERALATLRHLQQVSPHHVYVLKLLKIVYVALKDWPNLRQLLPELRKYKVFDEDKLEQIEQQTYLELLKSAIGNKEVTEVWQSMPKQVQNAPQILEFYVRYILQHNDSNKAETLLRDALKKTWDPLLISLYGDVQSDNLDKQIAHAENWLKSHPNDATLLFCLGKLCVKQSLWNKARDYFLASIQIEPQTNVLRELGLLYEQNNEIKEAVRYYHQALFKGEIKKDDFEKH